MSSLARGSYTLGSLSRRCAATGRALETGEEFVAALVQSGEPGSEQLERQDFSLAAWVGGARAMGTDGRRLAVLGSWRGVVPEPGAKKKILIDDESLLDLFEQSGEEAAAASPDSPAAPASRAAFRYLLALLLVRKRLLVCEKTDRRGTMFVRPRGSPKSSEGGVLSEVVDPGLSEALVGRVLSQLSAVLDGEAPAVGGAASGGEVAEVKP